MKRRCEATSGTCCAVEVGRPAPAWAGKWKLQVPSLALLQLSKCNTQMSNPALRTDFKVHRCLVPRLCIRLCDRLLPGFHVAHDMSHSLHVFPQQGIQKTDLPQLSSPLTRDKYLSLPDPTWVTQGHTVKSLHRLRRNLTCLTRIGSIRVLSL